MVSFLAIIVNSLSKQCYRSFSNINYGSVIGGGHMLEGKKFCFQGSMWSERKVFRYNYFKIHYFKEFFSKRKNPL